MALKNPDSDDWKPGFLDLGTVLGTSIQIVLILPGRQKIPQTVDKECKFHIQDNIVPFI
jgi:hypothetical protein